MILLIERNYLRHLLMLAIVSMFICMPQNVLSQSKSSQPNIIIFLVDDMGWQETSVPFHNERTELNDRFKTPNMERLADKGMIFTQAYASAICSPSRVSLITGTNPARHNVTCWTLFKDKSPEREHKTLKNADWNLNGLSSDNELGRSFYWESCLPEVLKKAGYYTMHIGKAHFGAKDTPGADPLNIGFDLNIAGHAAGGPGSYHGDKNFSAVWRKGMDVWDVPHLEKYHGQEINLTDVLTHEANRAIEKAVEMGQPFFLHMSHYGIHAPWEADRRFVQKYLDAGLPELLANHASMVEGMDHSLGAIMDKLEDLGIEDETIIVFISDNGAPSQMTRNLPLRGHKVTPYEGGIRVPMIVKWPGVTKKAMRNNHPIAIQDVYASIVEWAKAEDYVVPIDDTQSFLPLIKDKKHTWRDRALIWHYPNFYDVEPYSIIRKGNWKLIHFYHDGHNELYDLTADIGEQNNKADEEPQIVIELANELRNYLQEVEACRPYWKETGELVPWL